MPRINPSKGSELLRSPAEIGRPHSSYKFKKKSCTSQRDQEFNGKAMDLSSTETGGRELSGGDTGKEWLTEKHGYIERAEETNKGSKRSPEFTEDGSNSRKGKRS